MSQEEKQILLKDLSARLLYGVQAKVDGHNNPLRILGIERLNKSTWAWKKGTYVVSFWNDTKCIDQVKPYLRPMSSMTEKEKKVFDDFCVIDEAAWKGNTEVGYKNQAVIMSDGINWLNSHHFDYRGLIEKGLALEAPEGMYGIK